jgi:hypothetical protein
MSPFELCLVVRINIYSDYKRVFTRVGSDVCDRVGRSLWCCRQLTSVAMECSRSDMSASELDCGVCARLNACVLRVRTETHMLAGLCTHAHTDTEVGWTVHGLVRAAFRVWIRSVYKVDSLDESLSLNGWTAHHSCAHSHRLAGLCTHAHTDTCWLNSCAL